MCRSDTGPVLLLSQACRSRRTPSHAGPRWGHTGPGVGPELTERIAHVVERPVPRECRAHQARRSAPLHGAARWLRTSL